MAFVIALLDNFVAACGLHKTIKVRRFCAGAVYNLQIGVP